MTRGSALLKTVVGLGLLLTVVGATLLVLQWRRSQAIGFTLEDFLDSPKFGAPDASGRPTDDVRWVLSDLAGREVQFSDLRGRVVLLNMWATWCPPCIAEMPSFQRLHDSLADEEDIAFLFISNEPPELVAAFAAEEQLTLPLYTSPEAVPDPFRSEGIPMTFILSRDGRIVWQHLGGARWDGPETAAFLRQVAEMAPGRLE